MRRLWKSLALSLGVLATGARGQDAPRQPAASIGRPAASIGRPVTLAQPAAPPIFDPNVQTIAYEGTGLRPIVRGAAPDAAGRPLENVSPSMFAWRTPQDELAPRPAVAPLAVSPGGPINSGPVSSDKAPGGPVAVIGQPAAVDCDNSCGTNCCGSRRCGLFGCNAGLNSFIDKCRSFSLFDHGHGGMVMADPCDGGMACDGCYPGDRFYVKGEYLVWSLKGSPTPPLVTRSNIGQGDLLTQGALGPNSTVLFGGSGVDGGIRSGGRFTAGYWCTEDHLLGIEGSFFFLGDKNNSFLAASNGTPALGRPVDLLGTPGRQLVAGNELRNINGVPVIASLAGSVNVNTSSSFWGADLNLRTNLACGPNYYLDLIGGFRTLSLDESLSVTESLLVTGTTPVVPGAAGTTFMINDSFNTRNRFYGGQLGLAGEVRRGKWSLGLDAKLGLGETQQTVDISGSTTQTPGTTALGGLLTRTGTAGNIGHFTRDQFSLVPEVGLTLGYQLTDHVRAFVGYNFLYWTNVARPGNQIDTTVDRTQAFGQINPAGANRPTFNFNNSDFWAQGVSAGLEIRW